MNTPKKVTYQAAPHWIAAVILLIILCVIAYWYYSNTRTQNARVKGQTESAIKTTETGIKGLTGQFSEAKLTQTRDEATKLRENMLSPSDADAFIASLRPTWTVLSRSDDANDEFTKRNYQIARGSAPVSEWKDIMALITRLQKMAPVVVNSVDIQTVGDNRRRDFGRVSISMTIYTKKQN